MGLLQAILSRFQWAGYSEDETKIIDTIGKRYSAANKEDDSDEDAGYRKTSALTLEELQEVRRDPTVKIALLTPSMIIRSKIRSYTHPDPEIETFVRENLARVKFRKKLRKVMNYRWQGGSIFEMLWRPEEDGKIWLTDLIHIKPETWFDAGVPEEGKPVKQVIDGDEYYIPRDKCLIIENDEEFTDGGSILDATVHEHYKSKMLNLKKWDNALDLFGSPGLIGWLKSDGKAERIMSSIGKGDVGDPKEDSVRRLLRVLTAFKTSKAAAFTDDMALEKVQISQVGENYLTKIEYDDKMICRSMLFPSLMLSNDGTGSYAMSKTHFDYFMLHIRAELSKVCNEILLQMIRPLIMFNFQTLEYGHFNVDDLEEKDYKMWADIFVQLTVHGYLTPTNLAHVKKVLSLLQLLDDEVNSTDKTRAAKENEKMIAPVDSDFDGAEDEDEDED